jgi:tRNA pseudouridine38-40 synthase
MAYAHVPTIPDAPIPFHPTLSAHRKTYTYTFSIGPMYDPTQYRTVWYIGPNHTCPMMDDMIVASQCLVGIHDFNAFTGAPRSKSDLIQRQSDQYNTTCTIESIHISTHDVWTNQNTISTYTVEIIGDRFLYKMIRFMMGAMIAVGKGQLSIHDINVMLKTGQRSRKEFECAPAHPLILQNVQYNVPIQWQSV